ncbi:DNA topoisomerase 2 [Pyricularia oryzae]|nr:DNA topoisomerase 2 [Pyricularia oryzae]
MDLSDMDDSMNDFLDNESEGYSPEPKPKAKPAAKPAAKKAAAAKPKAAPKKLTQTKLTATKKRPKPESDNEDEGMDGGTFSDTPPSSKKQKKAPAPKKSANKILTEIENDSLNLDDVADTKPQTKKTATETYQKLTQLEHIIKRPDTYIGSVERTETKMWTFNKQTGLVENRIVAFVPGLYKIFDEILVNAADNSQRDKTMTYLKVTVDRESGQISVENNGKGIPVEMHEKEKVYIPELIFGHLLTGSNYDDKELKTVGGRNGYGAKLTNIFSTEFILEAQDSSNGKRYKQTWTNNMSNCGKAKITSNKTQDFVRVTFTPDYARFGMPDGIDDDLEGLLYRRVYDMAGTLDSNVKVHLNGEQLKVNFKKYCEMYAKSIAQERDDVPEGEDSKVAEVIFEDPKAHKRWKVGFTVSDGQFQQVSFVNSIATTQGGTHVNYIADQITAALLADLNKKKKGHSLKQHNIKNYIFIFVTCLIENPAFTSQTKEQLTTKASQFGSKCPLTEPFLKKVRQTEAIENIIHFAEKKADKMLSKSDGNKRSRISNEKLVDANLAGTKHGHECTLVLTEGDSARGLAVAGRAILDPDRIGVFPLRGKMLNVRDASIDQILKNKEIQNIKQFLGLKHKQVYTDTKGLRYGHLMIMADQDHDGSHIKGLLINFLQVQFPSLLQIPDFFQEFITPVVKVWQGSNPKKPTKLKTFFNMPQYEEWKEAHKHEIRRWDYKYLKGLGSSSNEDAQVYFTDLDLHLKQFHTMKPDEIELFELAFSKKKADARKEWLGNFIPGTFLDHSTKQITYSDFVNKELILFSMADNMRSIPSMIDGLKPGQRKVIFACFKQNLVKDKKVVELAGYVSEKAAYHHGEASLQQTIIGLAQNYVGSNNVNCLEPSGNFGSRLQGGSDAASARYIHTRLSPFARRVFNPLDEPVLQHQVDDGKAIEPKVYAPVIPMVLVNGADGIGTGWSTSIPNYHPEEIVRNIKRRMGRLDVPEEQEFEPMTPWWRGWKGTPEPEDASRIRFKFNGIANLDDKNPNEVVITELPIRMWTDDFKARLEEIIRAEKTPSWIKDYKEFNDHKNVHFIIQLDEKHMKEFRDSPNLLLERFKLQKNVAITNLVAFDTNGQIRKYDKVEDILEEFYHYRLNVYAARKAHWLRVFDADYRKLTNQYRFISEIIDGKLVVSKKKKSVLVQELRQRKYEPFPKGETGKKAQDEEEEFEDEEEDEVAEGTAGDYDYLLSMAIWSLTHERLERLKKQLEAKKAEFDELNSKSEKDLWCKDLDDFVMEWENQLKLDAEIQTNIRRMGRRVSRKIGAGKSGGRKAKADDDYAPTKAKAPAKAKPKAEAKKVPETKTHERWDAALKAESKPPVKAAPKSQLDGVDDFSDDDFAALSKPKTTIKKEPSPVEEVGDESLAPITARSKRAAATKKKQWIVDDDESESDFDDKMLDDVGAMVKGINKSADDTGPNRLSLFAMNNGENAASTSAFTKLKSKQSKTFEPKKFDFDSPDETNYEGLAQSSPVKSVKDDVDEFLSSDDDLPAVSKINAASKPAVAPKAPLSVVSTAAKKTRGRPAGAKNKSKGDEPAAAPKTKTKAAAKAKPVALSPAAKAYAAKLKAKKAAEDDDDDDDVDMEDTPPSPAPVAPKARGRPARAAAAAPKAKNPIYIDSEDEDEDDTMGGDDGDDAGEDFDMDSD